KIGGICWRTIPGPSSMTVTRKRLAWLGAGVVPPLAITSSLTITSGKMPASSQASRALSTASLTHVSKALRGLSKPSRWRFLVKNSETEMLRWRAPISAADTPILAFASATGSVGASSEFFIGLDILGFKSPEARVHRLDPIRTKRLVFCEFGIELQTRISDD